MSRRTDYKTCPDCGAHLDAGERCDCGANNGRTMGEQREIAAAEGRAATREEEKPCQGHEKGLERRSRSAAA